MDIKGYILEIYKPSSAIGISPADEIFLLYIHSGLNSAYKIYSHVKKKKNAMIPPISYKSVHKRVQKLLGNGMIEEVHREDGFAHGAKNYRLKPRGLIYIISEIVEQNQSIFIPFMKAQKDSIIIKTFIDPLFERKTVMNGTYTLTTFLMNYIIDCCEITRYCFERLATFEDNGGLKKSSLFQTYPVAYMFYRLNWTVKSFFLRCAMLDEKREDWKHYAANQGWLEVPAPSQGKIQCLANDRKETQSLLATDKKFMAKLREIEDDFKNGFNAMMENKDS